MKEYKNLFLLKIIIMLCVLIIPMLIEKFYYIDSSFSIDRYIIFSIALEFLIINILFDRKKIWDFIYKYRYIIGIVFFTFVVANGYHGSSLNIYNEVVEPENVIKSSEPIIGKTRSIRSDEWMVNTPMTLSQASDINNFSTINNTMMGKSVKVDFYPKLPTKSLSILASPKNIGFLFLTTEQAFSFYWFFEYFVLLFASFEFFMILTKKDRKWSFVGSLLIVFSPAVQWWEATTLLASGMLAMVFFDKFINSSNLKKRVLYSILIGLCGTVYIMNLYPAWMVPYGYFFLVISIWLLITNKGKYNFKDIALLCLISIAVICFLILPTYLASKDIFDIINNTVYPGKRVSVGGDGWQLLFNYILSPFLPYATFANASEYSQFISFYPIPLILGSLCLIKKEKTQKRDLLLLLLITLSILLIVWNYIKLPEFISKITLLSFSKSDRTQIVVGFIMDVILIYCISNYSSKKYEDKFLKFIISLSLTSFGIYILSVQYVEFSLKMQIISLVIFTSLNYVLLLNNEKSSKILFLSIISISIISGILVHPLCKGLDVFYEKDISKEMRKIVKDDKDALWASVNDFFVINNYALVNGARIINSTNYYPNYDLWKKIDPDKSKEEIWNRYSHLNIIITKEDTEIELLSTDLVLLKINSKNICNLNLEYLISTDASLENYSDQKLEINKIYSKYNMNIYNLKCN